ncbi:DUF6429 family protein [Ruegeria sp. Ofav3-42]|uniref:DUF6429 family protein n=1 Tax=Ruegeria sp. Ofav3-42 TaxID=2917759 RepID=UPI001EF4ABAF|nr:DUF6429 family protein [Ruegeria sp. Ofav3-42]MCG7521917.1 DUF6429 family protein [Ruegeria sp. Ofav3-42]
MTDPALMASAVVMDVDEDKVDDVVLALLWLTLHDERLAWKGFDWGALNRLHHKGMILDPKGKVKSVVLTEDGLRRSEALFTELFVQKPGQ